MTTTCNDKNCPEHGTLNTKGSIYLGTVVSDKMNKTVTVQWGRKVYVPKYERYLKRMSKVAVHNPPCINAKVGDYVEIKGTRPLSKTKCFVITKILGQKEVVQIEHKELLTKKERIKLKEKQIKETENEETQE